MFLMKDSYLPYLLCASSRHISPSLYYKQLRIFWTLISTTRHRFVAAPLRFALFIISTSAHSLDPLSSCQESLLFVAIISCGPVK